MMSPNKLIAKVGFCIAIVAQILIGAQLVKAQVVIDSTLMGQHPRLLLPANKEADIKKAIAADPAWRDVHEKILAECDDLLMKEPVERKLIGRRLLDRSREALRRTFFLAYAWRLTGKKTYFNRCEEELLSISKFQDWNPDHFLDVAEMTMAAAIGYDWLYSKLSPKSREVISTAIAEKGLTPSENSKYNGWLRGHNNWNQVCNTGITYGAIAVYENNPGRSVGLIKRAVESIKLPMSAYAPNGGYPEGYSYWAYGTSYNVFFMSALETLFHSDFGLNKLPGFMQTGLFYQHMTSPTGEPFNFSDSGGADALQPAMFWFADKTQQSDLLFIEKPKFGTSNYYAKGNRFLPAALIWGRNIKPQNISAPKAISWFGHGENPVALMRSDWGANPGIFVGFKGGTPSAGHGHMDIGSFVLEAEGIKWAEDLGMQGYESLESKGLNIWEMGQNSQRWQVYRYTNFAHNTLTVNGQLQVVTGKAPLIKYNPDTNFVRAVMDIGQVYQNNLKDAKRGIAIINKQYVTVRDEVEAGAQECTIRWQMLTKGTVSTIEGGQAVLTYKGKRLTLFVAGVPDVKIQTWRTDPPNSYDALNLGTTLVGFEIKVPANEKKAFNVILLPGTKQLSIQRSALKPLTDW